MSSADIRSVSVENRAAAFCSAAAAAGGAVEFPPVDVSSLWSSVWFLICSMNKVIWSSSDLSHSNHFHVWLLFMVRAVCVVLAGPEFLCSGHVLHVCLSCFHPDVLRALTDASCVTEYQKNIQIHVNKAERQLTTRCLLFPKSCIVAFALILETDHDMLFKHNKILTDLSVASMLLPQSDMNRQYYRTSEERLNAS